MSKDPFSGLYEVPLKTIKAWREKASLYEVLVSNLKRANLSVADMSHDLIEAHRRLEAVKKLLPLVEELYDLCRHMHLGNHQCAGCVIYGLPKKLRAAVEGEK